MTSTLKKYLQNEGRGHTEVIVVDYITANVRYFTSGATLQFALEWACVRGYVNMFKMLMLFKNVEPTYYCLGKAVEGNYRELVKLLLKDPCFCVGKNNNVLLIEAISKGHIDVAKMLLKDERVFAHRCKENEVLLAAIKGYHIELVKRILSNKDVNPSFKHDTPLFIATQLGQLDTVKLLLKDSRVGNMRWPLTTAVREGYVEIVKVLLADSRMDFSRDLSALAEAVRQGNNEILHMIMRCDKLPELTKKDLIIQFDSDMAAEIRQQQQLVHNQQSMEIKGYPVGCMDVVDIIPTKQQLTTTIVESKNHVHVYIPLNTTTLYLHHKATPSNTTVIHDFAK